MDRESFLQGASGDWPVSPPPPVRSGGSPGIRWPIHVQLLVPMVSVVLLASLLATAITVLWIAVRVRNEQSENLRRMVKTLGNAPFPLTKPVLSQMRGLSGAEFVLIGPGENVLESTLALEPSWLPTLVQVVQPPPAGDDAGTETVSLGEHSYLVNCVIVSRRSSQAAPSTLLILYPEAQRVRRVYEAVYPALMAGLAATVIAVAIATWLSRRWARPLRTLAARTTTIARGDFAAPVPMPPHNDELRDLADSINRMAEQLANYEGQVRHHERLRTLGQLGASMAHQLRNAAAGGRMAIELHRRECPVGKSDESLDVALRQLRLMESYLRQFLSIDEPAAVVRERVNLSLLLEDVLKLVRPSCRHAGIDLEFSQPPRPLFLHGDPESLRQLATNLVLNAAEAAVAGSVKPPRVRVELTPTAAGAAICVRDTGPGPSPEVCGKLFDSFVTTKPDGFGIGLFVARQIAQRHGGRLQWRREGETTCFLFEFPMEE